MLFVDDDNVITTQIRENFWLASYGSFRVIMMADCGYINATKLCLLAGKEFSNWKDNTSSLLLMNALEDELELSNLHDGNVAPINLDTVCKTIITDNRTVEDKLISGIYCHPLLIPHIACWCSPTFAFQITRVINFILIEEWKMKLARSQHAYVELLQRENATITNLRESLQRCQQQQQQPSSRQHHSSSNNTTHASD
jgi:KilA-N domain